MSFIKDWLYLRPLGFLVKLKRSTVYACFAWNNEDYDYDYYIGLSQFKLKRMLKCIENGYHDQRYKALKLAIKIGERLTNGEYRRFHKLYIKKHGRSKIDTVGLGVTFPGRTEEEREAYKAGMFESCRMDDAEFARDVRLYFNIIAKHVQSWWC